ncbi:MAG: PQQ-dependent sugar dehydrogenase, partial [Holophagales bacterium]|nr:PQQ-dependent sugar dehydrogenase [Holophagales bacterium]
SVSGNPNVADSGSATTVLTFNQPAGNHNGGDLHFGPDGYLYIASGDGGFDWCNSQDDSTLLGKILRIDADGDDFPGDPDANYAIPAGNPLVGVPGAAEEIWIMGLRNPWRFSFDRANGEMFIGDVGEGAWEEFNRIPAGVGGMNMGWPWFEGEDLFSSCAAPSGGPFASCDDAPFTCPFTALGRTSDGACSAIGGYRYRGTEFPGLEGLYFYTDWCGGIVKAAREEGASWGVYDVSTQGFGVTGFGESEEGELFFVNSFDLFQIGGEGFGIFADGFESGNTSAW